MHGKVGKNAYQKHKRNVSIAKRGVVGAWESIIRKTRKI